MAKDNRTPEQIEYRERTRKGVKGIPGRPMHKGRSLAKLMGDKFYDGAAHHICGTTLRYTISGACVACARRIQTEQRAARLEAINQASREPVDTAPGDEVEDAATRRKRAIDDLM